MVICYSLSLTLLHHHAAECNSHYSYNLPPDCNSEEAALRVLGYTPVSWDNLSGTELQPWSSIKHWFALTENEKAAAAVLGYTQPMWDNRSGSERQPVSFYKHWDELTTCDDGEDGLGAVRCVAVSSCLCYRAGGLRASAVIHVCSDS